MKKRNPGQSVLFPEVKPDPKPKRVRNRGAGRMFQIIDGPHAGQTAIYIYSDQTEEIKRTGKVLISLAGGNILIDKTTKLRTIGFID